MGRFIYSDQFPTTTTKINELYVMLCYVMLRNITYTLDLEGGVRPSSSSKLLRSGRTILYYTILNSIALNSTSVLRGWSRE